MRRRLGYPGDASLYAALAQIQGDSAFGAGTDWRNPVAGAHLGESSTSAERRGVRQRRTFSSVSEWSRDQCPHAGGLGHNIYGSATP